MKETVLITGVAGLLGSRLADWIINNKSEYKVVGIDDLSGGYQENINLNVDFYQINFLLT
jgi:UDP-glucose 4-epimerase